MNDVIERTGSNAEVVKKGYMWLDGYITSELGFTLKEHRTGC